MDRINNDGQQLPVPGRVINDSEWNSNPPSDQKPSKSRIDDAFSRTVSDSERSILLGDAVVFTVKTIADTVMGVSDKDAQLVIRSKIVQSGLRANQLPEVTQEFLQYVDTGSSSKFVPFMDGSERGYLSILCGFIEGARKLNQTGKEDVVDKIKENLDKNAERNFANTPSKQNGKSAVWIIEQEFSKEPTI